MTNIYMFTGDSFLIRKNVKALRESLYIQNEELNVATFRDMPSVDELVGVCAQVPFMSDKRLVILSDVSVLKAAGKKVKKDADDMEQNGGGAGKGDTNEGKLLADYLVTMPDTTVLIMCLAGAADKRRVLYKQIKKLGQIKEYADPKPDACVSFAISEAEAAGAQINRKVAGQLVQIVGCDYFAISNEIKKLAIYCDGSEITPKHIKECVSRSLEFDVFEMHTLFVQQKAARASALLQDIMTDQRPEALIGLFAYNLREMYKVKVMLDLKYSVSKIADTLKSADFIVRRRVTECKRFSQEELKEGLVLLANLDYALKSGKQDATLAMPSTLVKIYKL